ncbi:unnamed protein product [Rotaria socialis]|uniref:Transcription initiation factor TFIID subunit 2 n=5 Tax=Rotaria socialis TaxID=392032 RepID=A0A817Q291_9BILA|nr:unnamed protein product [Rotaria socialis]CAF3330858.1 unnamed protein product [Rotaria socialis]CAF3367053.1 unnamed protein product [Rotaria socialis]CAF3491784.1 unnamed protein product [Rotaria socialis]CAF3772376.1 unnamed protein product [Rotaria socialis]
MELEELRQVTRSFVLSHQTLCITGVSFDKRCLVGYTELTIHPLVKNFNVIKLNARQLTIYAVTINGERNVKFSYDDPNIQILSDDDPRRDLQSFLKRQQRFSEYVDPDEGNGELTIFIPSHLQKQVQNSSTTDNDNNSHTSEIVYTVTIDFSLERPESGIHFFIPDDDAKLSRLSRHLFTTGHDARLWFPCVDSYCEPATWTIEVTVEESLTVVASGELIECTTNNELKTYRFYLSTPAPAPFIGLAIGSFESVVDSNTQEISNYCLPDLLTLLTNTTSFVHEPLEYYEELLNASCQYPNYKQVFVTEPYAECVPFASMAIFNVNLLYPSTVIEATWHARSQMAFALANQFFGCFITMRSWRDWWLLKGLALYLASLYTKRAFGNNEYRYNLNRDMLDVIRYEREENPIRLDFAPIKSESDITSVNNRRGTMMSSQYLEAAAKKAHLVVRMIDDFIGREIMMQILNKLMCLATTACLKDASLSSRSRLHISSKSFSRVVSTLTTKDIQALLTQWVYESGCPRLIGSFTFSRKRNVVELELKQDTTIKGSKKFLGSLVIRVQELEGSFSQTILLEDSVTKYELTCHSKVRRNKKKKIPLISGDEVDMDLNQMDPECPILWIRIDPDLKVIRELQFEQADYNWQCELRYERDILSQFEALDALKRYPSQNTRETLGTVLDSSHCFYRVRIECAHVLTHIANSMANTWTGTLATLSFFRRVFMSTNSTLTTTNVTTSSTNNLSLTAPSANIVRINDFSNPQMYMIQKTIPQAIAFQRNKDRVCPPEVINFLFELIHYNENSKNRFSDAFYRSSLIDALGNTLTNVGLTSTTTNVDLLLNHTLDNNTKRIFDEILLQLNFDKIIPSYGFCVTCSCLKVLHKLYIISGIPIDINVFYEYATYGMFDRVRLTACEILVEQIETRMNQDVLEYIFNLIGNDPDYNLRRIIVQHLCRHPPFRQNQTCCLNNPITLHRLWSLMKNFAYDNHIRNDLVELYQIMFGLSRPNCLPPANEMNDSIVKDELDDVSDTIVDIDPERLSYFRLARYADDTKAAANKLASTIK